MENEDNPPVIEVKNENANKTELIEPFSKL